jgi:hypothetical protein
MYEIDHQDINKGKGQRISRRLIDLVSHSKPGLIHTSEEVELGEEVQAVLNDQIEVSMPRSTGGSDANPQRKD